MAVFANSSFTFRQIDIRMAQVMRYVRNNVPPQLLSYLGTCLWLPGNSYTNRIEFKYMPLSIYAVRGWIPGCKSPGIWYQFSSFWVCFIIPEITQSCWGCEMNSLSLRPTRRVDRLESQTARGSTPSWKFQRKCLTNISCTSIQSKRRLREWISESFWYLEQVKATPKARQFEKERLLWVAPRWFQCLPMVSLVRSGH